MSQRATNGMADAWNDLSTSAAKSTYSQTAYADFGGGINRNFFGYPYNSDGATRRAGMVNFKIAQGCAMPTGILYAGSPYHNADTLPCSGIVNATSDSKVGDGEDCVTQCTKGYTPSTEKLGCDSGWLSPATFSCSPSPCSNVTDDKNIADPPCEEGYIIQSGSLCTPVCHPGYTPTIDVVNCSYGELSSNFSCSPASCEVQNVAHGSGAPCAEGGTTVQSGRKCTTKCATGYSASVASLGCHVGVLTPESFTCSPDACTAPSSVVNGLTL